MCVMTVSWAGLCEPHGAHGEVVVRGAIADEQWLSRVIADCR